MSNDTDRPDEGDRTSGLVPGVVALALFGVMAAAFVGADFGAPAGLEVSGEAADTITHNVGYALLDLDLGSLAAETDGFLATFIIAALTLDVAVDGALYLAKREEGGSIISAVGGAFSGGRKVETEGDG